MEIETMTMTEKLLVVRRMIDRGELVFIISSDELNNIPDVIFYELHADFNADRNRIVVEI
jgi:hypothetical protein